MSLKIIINWSDPALSGLIFGSGLVCLLSLSQFSLLSVVAYFALTLLFFGLGCKVYVHLMGTLKKPCKDPLAKLEVIDVTISSENVETIRASCVEAMNTTVARLGVSALFRTI